MKLRRFAGCASLALAGALMCTACRPKHGGGETTTTSGDSGTEDSAKSQPAASVTGSYECAVFVGDKEFNIESCSIGASQELSLSGPELSLTGQVLARDHGLSFEGTLQVGAEGNPIAGALYHQGAGSFAAVFRFGDSSLAKITMVPGDSAQEIPPSR